MLTRSPKGETGSPARPLPVASLALTALALGVAFVPGAADLLEFERRAVAAGEVWRIVTSHWTHFGAEHLFWDAVAFLALGALCERYHRAAFAACIWAAALAIPIVVALTSPHLGTYRGLSGIDSALFALAVVLVGARAARERDRSLLLIALLAGALFAGKVAFEFVSGDTLFAQQDAMTPVPWAHVVGGCIGLAAGGIAALRERSDRAARSLGPDGRGPCLQRIA